MSILLNFGWFTNILFIPKNYIFIHLAAAFNNWIKCAVHLLERICKYCCWPFNVFWCKPYIWRLFALYTCICAPCIFCNKLGCGTVWIRLYQTVIVLLSNVQGYWLLIWCFPFPIFSDYIFKTFGLSEISEWKHLSLFLYLCV